MKLSEVTNFTGRLVIDENDRVYCMYFANCINEAATFVSNPILGDVPTCERCAAKVAAL